MSETVTVEFFSEEHTDTAIDGLRFLAKEASEDDNAMTAIRCKEAADSIEDAR